MKGGAVPSAAVPDRDSCLSRLLPEDEVTAAGQGTCSPTCQLLPPALPAYGGGHSPHLPRSGLSSAAAPAAGPRWRLLQQEGWLGEHVLQGGSTNRCRDSCPRPGTTVPRPAGPGDQRWLLSFPTSSLGAAGCREGRVRRGGGAQGARGWGELLPKVRRALAQRPDPMASATMAVTHGSDTSGGGSPEHHSPYPSVIWESWMGASSSTWLQRWARASSLGRGGEG